MKNKSAVDHRFNREKFKKKSSGANSVYSFWLQTSLKYHIMITTINSR